METKMVGTKGSGKKLRGEIEDLRRQRKVQYKP